MLTKIIIIARSKNIKISFLLVIQFEENSFFAKKWRNIYAM